MPKLGCAWSTFLEGRRPALLQQPVRWLWMMRWLEFARMLRAGRSVLMLDADTVVTENVYAYLKAPPFSCAQVI